MQTPPDELLAIYNSLNTEFFGVQLPPCSIRWSRRLTRTAGNIRVQTRVITLSVPLLNDVWREGVCFEVCGISCDNSEKALVEILKHEMIHLWLHIEGLPCGHTREFRQKARQIGQSKTRHGIALPLPKQGWVYECGACHAQLFRRRRFGKRVSCGRCARGRYDEAFRLRGRKIGSEVEACGPNR